jgi:hypothetical protein
MLTRSRCCSANLRKVNAALITFPIQRLGAGVPFRVKKLHTDFVISFRPLQLVCLLWVYVNIFILLSVFLCLHVFLCSADTRIYFCGFSTSQWPSCYSCSILFRKVPASRNLATSLHLCHNLYCKKVRPWPLTKN